MAASAESPLDGTIGELKGLLLDLQLAGDPASAALAVDISALINKHLGLNTSALVNKHPGLNPAAPVTAIHTTAEVATELGIGLPNGGVYEDRYLGEDDDYEEAPEPNRLVVEYRKQDLTAGALTADQLQAVLADAQAALELIGLGTTVVVHTAASDEEPDVTVVHYEVLEVGEVPLSSIPMGVGAGVVAGVGRVKARTSVAYVAPIDA